MNEQVERLLASEELRRSPGLERLLGYLAAQTAQGHVPKEIEIAEAVFGRPATDSDAGASVRVYVHRLRQKLDKFYAGPGADQPVRLCLPKGLYRLTLAPMGEEAGDGADAVLPRAAPGGRRRGWLALAIGILLAGFASGWLGNELHEGLGATGSVRRAALWRPFLDSNRRIALVLGDYYIFGELNDAGSVTRLVREFEVQSARDLARWREEGAERQDRFVDLDLTYLPIGVGDALRSIVPVVADEHSEGARLFTIPVSQLDARRISGSDLIYIGYISGLGDLRFPVFGGSRFSVGESYDEILDRRTGKRYVADGHLEANGQPGEDYALVSSIRGPSGNRILTIAGTRDAALMQVARFVSNPDTVDQLDAVAGSAGSFEALIGVDTMENVGLHARLISASARPDPKWDAPARLTFPDQMPQTR